MTMPTLHIDFETRSTVDLKKTGTHVYACDSSTDVWCMAWALDDMPIVVWTPENRNSEREVIARIRQGATVVAHNASFEWNIWNHLMVPRYGWPPLRVEQMRCTMAMAYSLSLPGSLENAAAAVGLANAKDMDGHKLMMQMARPRRVEECPECAGTGKKKKFALVDPIRFCAACYGHGEQIVWWDDEARRQRLYEYCKQDIEVERELEKRLLQLMPQEQSLWVLDQKINNRGIQVDLKAINAAMEVIASEKARLDKEIKRLTNGRANTCNQVMEITAWIQEQGVDCSSLAKGDVTELLAVEGLPAHVRAVLLCRQEAAKSSTAKLKAMRDSASADGRVRGTLQFHGASTGRWAGRRLQVQNFPRGQLGLTEEDVENVFNLLGG